MPIDTALTKAHFYGKKTCTKRAPKNCTFESEQCGKEGKGGITMPECLIEKSFFD